MGLLVTVHVPTVYINQEASSRRVPSFTWSKPTPNTAQKRDYNACDTTTVQFTALPQPFIHTRGVVEYEETMAVSTNNALYFFDCGVRETRMQLYRTFKEPKIYKFAKKFQYDKIIQRCKANPLLASKEAKFQHEYPPNQTALHLVLEPLFLMDISTKLDQELLQKRHEAAAALLEANKDAATMCCTFGTSPITMVCVDPFACPQDLEMLIRACPKSLLLTDLEGRTPLHYACINNRSNSTMMKILVKACPEAASAQDNLKKTPLHFAAMSIVTSCLDDAEWTGKLVAHSVNSPACSVDVIKLLIETNPEAVSTRDHQQRTPLHHLCVYFETQSSSLDDLLSTELLDVMELLVEADPSIAAQSDDTDCTPIAVIKDLHQRIQVDKDTSEKRQQQCETLERIISFVGNSKVE